jgi:hypothetical protein
VTVVDAATLAAMASIVAVYLALRLRPGRTFLILIQTPVGSPAPPGNPQGPETTDMPISPEFQAALDAVADAHKRADAAKDAQIVDLKAQLESAKASLEGLKASTAADIADEITAVNDLANAIAPPPAAEQLQPDPAAQAGDGQQSGADQVQQTE